MSKLLGYSLASISGAAIGSICTYSIMKTRYDELYDEMEYYKDLSSKENDVICVNESPEVEEIVDVEVVEEPKEQDPYEEALDEFITNSTFPFIIDPDEYGENGYRCRNLIYFDDGVMVDENYSIIDDFVMDELINIDNLSCFGEYQKDYLYVRNDIERCDFKIYQDERMYSEVVHD